jgi:hypothetical protein
MYLACGGSRNRKSRSSRNLNSGGKGAQKRFSVRSDGPSSLSDDYLSSFSAPSREAATPASSSSAAEGGMATFLQVMQNPAFSPGEGRPPRRHVEDVGDDGGGGGGGGECYDFELTTLAGRGYRAASIE